MSLDIDLNFKVLLKSWIFQNYFPCNAVFMALSFIYHKNEDKNLKAEPKEIVQQGGQLLCIQLSQIQLLPFHIVLHILPEVITEHRPESKPLTVLCMNKTKTNQKLLKSCIKT